MKSEKEKRLHDMGLCPNPTSSDAISLVRVPPNESEDLSELFFQTTQDSGSDDPLVGKLDPYFALYQDDDESVNMELIQTQVLPAYQKGCEAPGGMCPHVSMDTLRKHAEAGNLESLDIKLTQNDDDDDDDDDKMIRLYYDDSAVIKGRPLNTRVSSAFEQEIHGDVFLVQRNKDGYYESLTIQDATVLLRKRG